MNNIPVALPLFDEEIFQKIPVFGRPGPTSRPDPPARSAFSTRAATTYRPDTTELPGTVAKEDTVRLGTTVRAGTNSRPTTPAAAPAFSPRLIRVETERVTQPPTASKPAAASTTTKTSAVVAAAKAPKSVADLVEVYDYYAANQIQFEDHDDDDDDAAAAVADYDDDLGGDVVRNLSFYSFPYIFVSGICIL